MKGNATVLSELFHFLTVMFYFLQPLRRMIITYYNTANDCDEMQMKKFKHQRKVSAWRNAGETNEDIQNMLLDFVWLGLSFHKESLVASFAVDARPPSILTRVLGVGAFLPAAFWVKVCERCRGDCLAQPEKRDLGHRFRRDGGY